MSSTTNPPTPRWSDGRARIRDYGDRALLIECGDIEVLALAATLRQARLPGVSDIVPGARTVLLHLDAVTDRAQARSGLETLDLNRAATAGDAEPVEVVIEVVYDGEGDLAGWHAG